MLPPRSSVLARLHPGQVQLKNASLRPDSSLGKLAHRRCVKKILGSRWDKIWRAGGRRGLFVGCRLGLITRVGIAGRMLCRVKRMICRMGGFIKFPDEAKGALLLVPLPLRLGVLALPLGIRIRAAGELNSSSKNCVASTNDLRL